MAAQKKATKASKTVKDLKVKKSDSGKVLGGASSLGPPTA